MAHYFRLKTELIDCCITLNEKYNLISGFSGNGKSTLVNEVERVISEGSRELDCSLEIVVISNTSALRAVDDSMVLYICDEFLAYKLIEKTLNKNSYCILVTRKIYKNINMSVNSLYEAQRNLNGITKIVSKYNIATLLTCTKYDIVVTEDKEAGFNYFKTIFKNIESAKGKSNIVSKIKSLPDFNSLLIVADYGGLASDIKNITKCISRLRHQGKTIDLLLPECFEHILLCSEFLGFDENVYNYYDVKFNNTETFCENLIADKTKGKPYEFNHGNQELSHCWVIDCNKCDNKCPSYVDKNKYLSVLGKGPAKDLLHTALADCINTVNKEDL